MDELLLRRYIHSPAFLQKLGLPGDAELSLSPLGQGEYNLNYRFTHPATGRELVLRINTGSQMHLSHQIVYEYDALRDLAPSGRTPEALFCDDSRGILPWGALVMEWLPGRALRYGCDLPAAAEILADIHAVPVPEDSRLFRPERPAYGIYEECLAMAAQYFDWDGADAAVCRLLEALISEVGRLPLKEPSSAPACIVNTELNSGNFLINEGARSYLIDWEKPLLSEPAQDLGHFLAPTTTLWKTDVVLTAEEMEAFVCRYRAAVGGRFDVSSLLERLPLFLMVNCLRGVSWCAMALREYSQDSRPVSNADTLAKIKTYLSEGFLRSILKNYVRQNLLREVLGR